MPYITPMFYYTHDFLIGRLYDNSTVLSIPEFQIDLYYSFLFSTVGQVCIGFGWDMAEIVATVETTI